jgi:hypothetical protein
MTHTCNTARDRSAVGGGSDKDEKTTFMPVASPMPVSCGAMTTCQELKSGVTGTLGA